MQLITRVDIPQYDFDIDYSKAMLFIGSCFSQNISNKLINLKFDVLSNPFGILYNPISIIDAIDIMITERYFTSEDIFYYNGKWHSFYHHGSFSNVDRELCLKGINDNIAKGLDYLKHGSVVFITFGSAYVYMKEGSVVANCHKLPTNNFSVELLDVDMVVEKMVFILEKLFALNSDLRVVFSVSPVRYKKYGMHANNIGKSVLLLSIYKVVGIFKNVYYFPAYEIVIDELRDYRFYDRDMLHPNDIAIDYIWERFVEAFFTKDTINIMKEIEKINKAVNHRLFDKTSNTAIEFASLQLKKIEDLQAKYSFINLLQERRYFEDLLRGNINEDK